MPATAENQFRIRSTELRFLAVEVVDSLQGSLIVGTPTLLSSLPSGLTVTDIGRLSSTKVVRGKTILADQAIVFTVTGGDGSGNGTLYTLVFSCTTSTGEILNIENVQIYVKD